VFLPKKVLIEKMRRFLEEDAGEGDITTSLTIPEGTIVEAEILAKETGIIAGLEEVSAFLEDFGLQAKVKVADGAEVKPGMIVLKIVGDARTLLTLERSLLNILSRMSGIATATNRIVAKVRSAGYKMRIACTRKVAPGLAYFDKKAVMVGGGDVHRFHLDDMVLIKDNHIAVVGSVEKAVSKARNKVSFSKKIEVEVSSTKQALEAAKAKADIIMLDNFAPKQVTKTLETLKENRLRRGIVVEASGGINEKNVLEYASTGVNVLSLGEITDSAKALDTSLEVVKVRKAKK
jgi:nicotinate-nucleotide pyrophosphorylase (carboxylating)